MLTDNEIRRAVDDTLEFNAFAETLGEIIISSEPPLTVGVYGEWGSGKTSLMRLTQEVLEKHKKKKIKTSWFNAWKYDKAHDLRVALINTILKEITEEGTTQELKDKAKGLLKRVNWTGLGKTALSLGATLLAPNLDISKILPDNILKEEGEEKTIELIGEFEEEYKNIIKSYVGEDGMLVVFIDDLDRCLPEKTIDILEAIKLFLHVPHSVFVIGADREIIVDGIMKKYGADSTDPSKKSDEWGTNYLEKIIQIPFRLPPLRTDVIANNFIEKLDVSEEIKKHKDILAQVRKNPRTIKRLLNNFELQMILAEKRGLAIEENILAKLTVLEFKWASFHKNLIDLYGASDGKINLIEIADLDKLERDERLKDLQGIKQYYNDKSLMDFIEEEPSLIEAKLGDYVYLAGTAREETKEETKDATYYFNMGYASNEKGDFDKAIEHYNEVLKLEPDHSDAYHNRGFAYLGKGEYDKAIKDYDKEIELNPEFFDAYYNRGLAFDNKEEYDRAIKDYDKAIELNREYYFAHNNRGVAYDNKGESDRAIEDYINALELDPEHALAYDNIINLLNDVLAEKKQFPRKWDSSSVKEKIMSSDLEKKKKDKITALLKKLKA